VSSPTTRTTTLFSLDVVRGWLKVTSSGTKTISSLTSAGLVATAVSALHGFQTGDVVAIAGASPAGYNGLFRVTVPTDGTFTYALPATVTTPATGTPTATLDDGRLLQAADGASAEIERQTGCVFVSRSCSEARHGNGRDTVLLKFRPIVSVSSVTIGGAAVLSTEYVIDADLGSLTLINGRVWTEGRKNVVLAYVAGWGAQDADTLPADVYRAGLDLAKAIYDELAAGVIAVTTVNVGASSMVLKTADFPPSVKRVIDTWRDWRVLA
jgi:hypothetical protein